MFNVWCTQRCLYARQSRKSSVLLTKVDAVSDNNKSDYTLISMYHRVKKHSIFVFSNR